MLLCAGGPKLIHKHDFEVMKQIRKRGKGNIMQCPQCKSNKIECTTVGIINGPDTNRAVCLNCNYKGTVQDWKDLEEYQKEINSVNCLTWSNDPHKKAGLYIRCNPSLANFHPSIEKVYSIKGEMCIGPRGGDGLNMLRLSEWGGGIRAKKHLWYGPIKQPIKYQNETQIYI